MRLFLENQRYGTVRKDSHVTNNQQRDLSYERLLEENDWDLYYWVTGAQDAPGPFAPLIRRLAVFHKIR